MIQEIDFRLPRFACRTGKGSVTRSIPRDAWRDPLLKSHMLAILIDTLQKSIHGTPVHYHEYSAAPGSGGPTTLAAAIDPHLEIYLDGSADQGVAAWAFLIVSNVPIRLGQAVETVDAHHHQVFRRYGRVVTNPRSDWFVGAHRETNTTGEISAFIEAMLFILFEA